MPQAIDPLTGRLSDSYGHALREFFVHYEIEILSCAYWRNRAPWGVPTRKCFDSFFLFPVKGDVRVPPSASKIQAARDNGNVSFQPLSESRARIVFTNYQLQGDTYNVEVNLKNNRPLSLKVSTYVNDPNDVVKLNVVMGQLENGATYPSEATLVAENKGITVTVTNSGYRRTN